MTTYRADRQGLAAIRSSSAMGRAMEQVAHERGVPAFRAAAPVGPTGEYRDLVDVEPHRGAGRAGAALVLSPDSDDDPNAPVPITFGTVDTPEHGALQAAIEAIERE